MHSKQSRIVSLLLWLACMAAALPVLARGDKVIPQVPDGIGGDGTVWKTKFDITNLGPTPETRITNVRVLFFHQNGTPWTVATNLGNVSEITLDLGAFQTIRIETRGTTSTLTSGYAIVRNLEPTTQFSEDHEVALTVFYEISRGSSVIDTVSVEVGQPTMAWVFPVETDVARNLLTGFAAVNLADAANTLTLSLYTATTPTSGNATLRQERQITLNANEQRSRFLVDASLFPDVTPFKGMLLGRSEKPVSILALLQTAIPGGVQYATMVPAYADALRRNTAMYLRQGFPLDADIPVSDYVGNPNDTLPWDLLYETQGTTSRRLLPRSGAAFSVIGTRTADQFDDEVTISFLRGLTYGTNPIDLSEGSANLASGFAFAIRTALGQYVKVRIAEVINRGNERDLALEMYVYR
jgi:hypothetical protein